MTSTRALTCNPRKSGREAAEQNNIVTAEILRVGDATCHQERERAIGGREGRREREKQREREGGRKEERREEENVYAQANI